MVMIMGNGVRERDEIRYTKRQNEGQRDEVETHEVGQSRNERSLSLRVELSERIMLADIV